MLDQGLDGLVDAVRHIVRQYHATLLILDGMSAAEHLAASGSELGQITQRLQTHLNLLGCTAVLLSSGRAEDIGTSTTHVDGVIELFNVPAGALDVRELRVMKLRGSGYLSGRHEFRISDQGIRVYPRPEAVYASLEPVMTTGDERTSTGVAGLDRMMHGGLLRRSSTMVLGTPGAGKSVLALHFLAAGLAHGERGVMATFQETQESIIATARGIGLNLSEPASTGELQVMWRSPLELSPDAWAWDLLTLVDQHHPQRVVIDSISDLARHFRQPERFPSFLQSLTNVLRSKGITTLFLIEIDVLVGSELVVPVRNLSAITDAGLVLRTVEMHSTLHHTVAIQKMRMSGFDGSVRHVTIDGHGMHIGDVFESGPGALTGIPQA
jgi:circadian clock protein KaiC